MRLESGASLGPVTVAYETYGRLNEERTNAILIVHALSGSAHAAGYHSEEDAKPGWWDECIGPGKAFDTNRFFVICSNVLGSCYGSTGPSSINPATGKPYGLSFPVVTIGDMVQAQVKLIDHLGIDQLLCVAGGSMGGMQVLEWAANHPTRVKAVIPLATTAHHSPMLIAFSEVGRQAIYADPAWANGDYYESGKKPDAGLAVARMVGHITYLSEESMQKKFGRQLRSLEQYGYEFETEFEIESYLKYNGNSFTRRFETPAARAKDVDPAVEQRHDAAHHLLGGFIVDDFHLDELGQARVRLRHHRQAGRPFITLDGLARPLHVHPGAAVERHDVGAVLDHEGGRTLGVDAHHGAKRRAVERHVVRHRADHARRAGVPGRRDGEEQLLEGSLGLDDEGVGARARRAPRPAPRTRAGLRPR